MDFDDDDFGDEFGDVVDLDDLPADALDEIEERAIASTQAAQNNNVRHDVQQDDMLVDGDEEDVINLDAPQRPAFVRPQIPQQIDEVTAREQWRQSRYSAPSRIHNESIADWHNVTYSQAQAGPGQPSGQVNNQDSHAEQPQLDVAALQARIAELEQQQLQVQKKAEDANAAYMFKAGEIAIVRANHEKAAKEYERRMAVMQQLHAEEVGKQKAELDRMRRDRDKVETDNRFLQHDLAQEAEKTKTMKRTVVVRQAEPSMNTDARSSPTSTPKKDKSLAHRDGFDDDEVIMISPSKRKEKSKPSTPKGTKRKRPEPNMDQSPGLPMVMDDSPVRPADIASPVKQSLPTPVSTSQDSHEKFKTLQMVLGYRPGRGPKPVMEILSVMMLPDSRRSVASNISDDLALLPSDQTDDAFRLSLCLCIANQWSECLKQNLHDPISYLCDLLMYILLDSPEALSTQLMRQIAPLCLKTTDLVAVPTARAAQSKMLEDAPSAQLKLLIDPLDYLDLLQLLTVNCLSDDEALASFWSTMEWDFVLIMLHRAQPVEQIMQMLQLLSTSILPGSFGATAGPRNSDVTPNASAVMPPQQNRHEAALIDRLTVLLFETPSSLLSEAKHGTSSASTPSKPVLLLRTQVLNLLTELADSQYGGLLLAQHRTAFARLVRFLHDAILAMYDYFPEAVPAASTTEPTPSLGKTPFKTSHDHYTTHVNLTVLLLATLTDVLIPSPTDPTTTTRIDVRTKLSAVPGYGAPEKHLISLSRIAFADGLTAIERGIDVEAADAAHRMLDELLSPEEGDNVVQVFGGSAP